MDKFLNNKIEFKIKLNNGDRIDCDNGNQLTSVGTDYITTEDSETGDKTHIPFTNIAYVEEIHVEEV